MTADTGTDSVTYEDLTILETELANVDINIIRQQWLSSHPLFLHRSNLVSRIPHFWALVFDEVPPEIESRITPADSELFAECLVSFEVDRFELEREPRSFLLRFSFSENDWFEDKVLEKKFWHRRSSDNWQGLVSEPVKISWKSEKKDLTNGLNAAVCELWKEFEKSGRMDAPGLAKLRDHSKYKKVVKIVEGNDTEQDSFFSLFSFVSAYRLVDEKESDEANRVAEENHQRRKKGDTIAPDAVPDSAWHGADDMMPCPHGEDLAIVLAEDVFPHAIKYFSKYDSRIWAHSNS
jgi:hypothetical protein